MSESAIADFVADVAADADPGTEPVRGRVVLSQRRLVLATDDGRRTVPLDSVFDIRVGRAPGNVAEFFDDVVTIGYTRGDDRLTAVVEADADTVDRFVDLLFRARLSGTRAKVVHPARVGGRVTDAGPRSATLRLPENELVFADTERRPSVVLSAVVGFERAHRDIGGTERPVVRVAHATGERTLTTEVALGSAAKLNVLGRYIRLEYSATMADLEGVDVPEDEMELLLTLHSAGEDPNLPGLLGRDAGEVSALLGRLVEKDLVADDGATLTSRGQMVVESRVESVNV